MYIPLPSSGRSVTLKKTVDSKRLQKVNQIPLGVTMGIKVHFALIHLSKARWR